MRIQCEQPASQSMTRCLIGSFRQTDSEGEILRSGRQRSARTEENIEGLLNNTEEEQGISIRRRSLKLNGSQISLYYKIFTQGFLQNPVGTGNKDNKL